MKTIILVLSVIAFASAGVILPGVPLAYSVSPLVGRIVVPEGHGLEGQYIPDNLEKLHDDGSYRPELQLASLRASPYGLVPSGSGLEGSYVPDLTEKFYDDGSYKPEINVLV